MIALGAMSDWFVPDGRLDCPLIDLSLMDKDTHDGQTRLSRSCQCTDPRSHRSACSLFVVQTLAREFDKDAHGGRVFHRNIARVAISDWCSIALVAISSSPWLTRVSTVVCPPPFALVAISDWFVFDWQSNQRQIDQINTQRQINQILRVSSVVCPPSRLSDREGPERIIAGSEGGENYCWERGRRELLLGAKERIIAGSEGGENYCWERRRRELLLVAKEDRITAGSEGEYYCWERRRRELLLRAKKDRFIAGSEGGENHC